MGAATDSARIQRERIDVRWEESFSELTVVAPYPSAIDEPVVNVGCRSDLQELLASFLSHTRSEERMTRELRRMIGVDRSQDDSAEQRVSLFGQGSGARH